MTESNPDPEAMPPAVQKGAVIFVILGIPLFFIYMNHLSNSTEKQYLKDSQQAVTSIMKAECAKNCAAYGLTESQLIGPELKKHWSNSTRVSNGAADIVFLWHSNPPKTTLQIEEYAPPYPSSFQVSCTWDTSNNPDPTKYATMDKDHQISTMHEYKLTKWNAADLSCE